MALEVLEHRFGQSAMIVQALKSSVTDGPKIRPGDNAVLLALSDKIENCWWALSKLGSCELDCTTNLRHTIVCQVTFKESGEILRCCIARGQLEESRT